nr:MULTISPECIES: hypothetical protein [Burkholderia cepacia complex]
MTALAIEFIFPLADHVEAADIEQGCRLSLGQAFAHPLQDRKFEFSAEIRGSSLLRPHAFLTMSPIAGNPLPQQ